MIIYILFSFYKFKIDFLRIIKYLYILRIVKGKSTILLLLVKNFLFNITASRARNVVPICLSLKTSKIVLLLILVQQSFHIRPELNNIFYPHIFVFLYLFQ